MISAWTAGCRATFSPWINSRNLDAGGIVLKPNQSYTLPDGNGTISFDGIKRFAALDIRHDPGEAYVLVVALWALAGLMGSLFLNRRRVWVRTGNHPDGRTMVEFGLLARGEDHRLAGEYAAINKALHAKWLVPMDAAGQNDDEQIIINDSAQSVTAASKDQ